MIPKALALAFTCCLAAPAAAGPMLEEIGCPSEAVNVVILGDSLADGLWGSFQRAFGGCASVEVVRGTTVSDGLAKTAPDEWLARIEAVAEPDLIVVQMGANDITNIREGTTRAVFGSPEWEAAYAARAGALAQGLTERAPVVIWMGLPIVGQARFEDSYRAITALQAEAALGAGVAFVDTHEPTTFGVGEFVMSAEVDGTVRQLRNTDQVHFTELGYDLVAGLLHRDVASVFRQAGREVAIDALVLQ